MLDKATLEKLAKVGIRVVQPNSDSPHVLVPLFHSKVSAGLPDQVGEGTAQDGVDLHKHCIPRPESSYLLHVSGSSMRDAGIVDGDLLVVDQSIRPKDGQIVIAQLDGEVTVKRLRHKGKTVSLVPENPEYPVIPIREDQNFTILGVVTYVIHSIDSL